MAPSVKKCRKTVDRLRRQGATMPEIERFVDRSGLPEEEGAVLWLYAHALGCRRHPREAQPPEGPHLVVHP
jgi:hypothetical protein